MEEVRQDSLLLPSSIRPMVAHTAKRLALLALVAACTDLAAPPVATRTPATAELGVTPASPTWQVSYAGSEWYHRARSWAVNDSNVVVGSVQLGADDQSTKGFWSRNGVLQLLLLGQGRIAHVARGINRAGEIVGWVSNGEGAFFDTGPMREDSAFHRSTTGITTTLPITSEDAAGAYDINDSGWIAGFMPYGGPVPVLWIRGNGGHFVAHRLGGPEDPNRPSTDAVAVNGSGLVVGTAWYGDGVMRMSLNAWDDLSDLDYGYCASDINDSNVIVGIGPDSTIVTFPGFGITPQGIKATSRNCYDGPRISNRGRIAGTRQRFGAFTKMYGVVENLPLPSGARYAYANGINTCGTISGSVVSSTTGRQRPVIWRRMAAGVQVCD